MYQESKRENWAEKKIWWKLVPKNKGEIMTKNVEIVPKINLTIIIKKCAIIKKKLCQKSKGKMELKNCAKKSINI